MRIAEPRQRRTLCTPKGADALDNINGNRDVLQKESIVLSFQASIPPRKTRLFYQNREIRRGITTVYRLEGIYPPMKGARLERQEVITGKVIPSSDGKFRLVIVHPVKKAHQ